MSVFKKARNKLYGIYKLREIRTLKIPLAINESNWHSSLTIKDDIIYLRMTTFLFLIVSNIKKSEF